MIKLKNVTKKYKNKTVINRLNLTLPNSGIVLLTGKNGSGKTTLLRLIAGLEKPTKGAVLVPNGCRVSYAFQDYRLVPTLTALENINFVLGGKQTNDALQWLEKVGLANESGAFPNALSGGMQQRLGLARALAFESDVLLLDEPFSALDDESKQKMMDLVLEYAATRLVVLVSHDAAERNYLGGQTVNLDEMN